ncbi:MAG: DUF1361 domain-containing protein [Acidobacteriota bacterium]
MGLLLIRWWLTASPRYTSLVRNLFLAAVPLGFAFWLSAIRQRLVGVGLLAGWLLFFPNAPYVMTDFIHLSSYGHAPLWFDVLLLASFALAALCFGLVSLNLVVGWAALFTACWLGRGAAGLPARWLWGVSGTVWVMEQLGCAVPSRGITVQCGGTVGHARGVYSRGRRHTWL